MSTTESIYISAQVAADRIGRSKRRVNQLVADGELDGVKIGNMNAIQANSVARYLSKRDKAARIHCPACHAEVTSADRQAGECTQCGGKL